MCSIKQRYAVRDNRPNVLPRSIPTNILLLGNHVLAQHKKKITNCTEKCVVLCKNRHDDSLTIKTILSYGLKNNIIWHLLYDSYHGHGDTKCHL